MTVERTSRSATTLVWNEQEFDFLHENDAIQYAFMCLSVKMIYQPSQTIRDNVSELCKTFIEYLTYKKMFADTVRSKELGGLIRKLRNFNKSIANTAQLDGKKGVGKMHDFILRLSGLNVLPGFGFKNTLIGSASPEKQSVVPQMYNENEITNQLIS